jgi:hypothetical protein
MKNGIETKGLVLAALAGFAMAAGAQDLTWRNDVAPIIRKQCAECHGAAAPDFGEWMLLSDDKRKKIAPRLDAYVNFMNHVVWPATGSVMRRLDDGTSALAGGKPGNMHKHLGETDEERARNLKAIKAWLGEGAWNLNRFEVRANVPGVTKEQFEKIKAKY